MTAALWSESRTFTVPGPLSGTGLMDVTDSGLVPNTVVMPTRITMPFTGFIVTKLAEIPLLPLGITLSGTLSPAASGSGVGLSVTPMWRNDATGNGSIATNGLSWFSLNFASGQSSASTSYNLPALVPPGMFGGTGANQPLTHWLWTIAAGPSVTYTMNVTCSFIYEIPCWDGIYRQTLPTASGAIIDLTPTTALPSGATIATSVPGVGSVTAVAINSTINSVVTITNTMDARTAGTVDIWIVTFDSGGTIVNQYHLAAFTASVSSWRGVDITLTASEVYWYFYVVNSSTASGGHVLASSVRYFCTAVVGGAATGFVTIIG